MTTVVLRNLPNQLTRKMLLDLLEDEGMGGSFDFVYLPVDFSSNTCLGHAFVNFVSASDAARCWQVFKGFKEWDAPVANVCDVQWSDPRQGIEALIEHYRNSPVMHTSILDEWKPAVFDGGMRIPFPVPTKPIKAPKLRSHNKAKVKA